MTTLMSIALELWLLYSLSLLCCGRDFVQKINKSLLKYWKSWLKDQKSSLKDSKSRLKDQKSQFILKNSINCDLFWSNFY